MKNAFRFIVLFLLLGGWTLAALALHVVYAPGKLVVIPKNQLSFTDTYADIRAWTLEDVAKHPVLVNRLIALDKSAVLNHVADTTKNDLKSQLLKVLTEGFDPKKDAPKPTPGKK